MLDLTSSFIDAVSFKGKQYEINLAFDHVLKFFDLVSDDSIDNDYLSRKMIELFFGGQKIPQDPEFLQGFMKMLNKLVNAEPYLSGGNSTSGSMVQSFSWSKDAGMIEAAFLQNYQIDLMEEQGKMHWTKFKALFDGLSDNTRLIKIIQIRQTTPSDVTKEEWPRIAQAQVTFSLDDPMKDAPKASKQSASFNTSAMFQALLDKAHKKGE